MRRAPLTDSLTVHRRSAAGCVASLDHFVLLRCYGAMDRPDLLATLDAFAVASRARPNAISSLTVIDPSTEFPTEDARRVCIQLIEQTHESVRAGATVVLGDGFCGSALRSVLTTFNAIGGRRRSARTFGDLGEAVPWLLDTGGDARATYEVALLDALESMRPAT